MTNENTINKEEMLNQEQLDNVAGGSISETAADSIFLNKLGYCKSYGTFKLLTENHEAEIRDAWAKVGVEATIHTGGFFSKGDDNVYKIDGKTVSRQDAINHAMEVTGRNNLWAPAW